MDSITLGNYRCFHEKQTARLAPLTLLIGENSTGKTSFLALIRALWDVAYGQRIPDFKEEPYDLGSFREITYDNNESGSLTDSFIGGFEVFHKDEDIGIHENPLYFETTFKKIGTRPIPIRRFYSHGENSIEEIYNRNHVDRIRLSTARGSWEQRINQHPRFVRVGGRLEFEDYLTPVFFYLHPYLHEDVPGEGALERLSGSPAFTERDLDAITRLVHSCDGPPWRRPFASAPVRSKPHRTYDPSRPTWDPEGDYIPMYLASLYSQDNSNWEELRSRVEGFGRGAGLFDEILIKQLGERDGGPFQIQIRQSTSERKGTRHNLIDVGYGISQVLPLVTELLREDAPNVLLLQQPEVHLHPSAQAALGSLFCQEADRDRQLVIETHSDHIIDRIRMDVRDGVSSLTPDDVSVLFFERADSGVRIHSLRFDEEGNILGAPTGYRRFFMKESRRSIGL